MIVQEQIERVLCEVACQKLQSPVQFTVFSDEGLIASGSHVWTQTTRETQWRYMTSPDDLRPNRPPLNAIVSDENGAAIHVRFDLTGKYDTRSYRVKPD